MNFNDNPEKLKREEQSVLNDLISRMDEVIKSLDQRMKIMLWKLKMRISLLIQIHIWHRYYLSKA